MCVTNLHHFHWWKLISLQAEKFSPKFEMTEQEQEQEFYELPPFSLTFEGKNYDLFNSLSDSNVLLFGEDYVPQTIEIPISSDEELYSSVLYESAIIYLVLELKSMLGIVNSDVIVKLPQLDLEIHEVTSF